VDDRGSEAAPSGRGASVKGGATGAPVVPGVPIFYEAQRFRMWIFWLPIVIVTFVVWWQFTEQIILGHPQGTEPIPDWAAWLLAIVFGLGFPAFALLIRLVTEVVPGELVVRLYPFKPVRLPLSEIKSAEARDYSPLREFGGWGIRMGAGGKAYNAHGDRGVQLVMIDDRRILIGSQHAKELAQVLHSGGVADH
jgi:hypothetical protein